MSLIRWLMLMAPSTVNAAPVALRAAADAGRLPAARASDMRCVSPKPPHDAALHNESAWQAGHARRWRAGGQHDRFAHGFRGAVQCCYRPAGIHGSGGDCMANEWARKVGQVLRHVRPGLGALATSRLTAGSHGMVISSPAFEDGGAIPMAYTQDGESLFPPLRWDHVPGGAESLALLVEDADAPFPRPLVHALLHSIPPTLSGIPEGGVARRQVRKSPLGFKAGRNSVARAGWMAPSPMPGHGPHRYAFQLLAVDTMPSFANPPSRGAVLRATKGHLIA